MNGKLLWKCWEPSRWSIFKNKNKKSSRHINKKIKKVKSCQRRKVFKNTLAAMISNKLLLTLIKSYFWRTKKRKKNNPAKMKILFWIKKIKLLLNLNLKKNRKVKQLKKVRYHQNPIKCSNNKPLLKKMFNRKTNRRSSLNNKFQKSR